MDWISVSDIRRGADVKVQRVGLICSVGPFRRDLAAGLEAAGLAPQICVQGPLEPSQTAVADPDNAGPDLLVFCLGTVTGDPARVVKQLHDRWAVPLLVLANGHDESEEIACLRSGADDYLRPPVRVKPLIERILRRLRLPAGAFAPPDRPVGEDHVLMRGALNMDARCHVVTWQGRRVPLTQTEFLVLQALARRPGHVKTREQLLDIAYGDGGEVEDRSIDSHIKRLRKKIRTVDPGFAAIETLYGIGYRYAQWQRP